MSLQLPLVPASLLFLSLSGIVNTALKVSTDHSFCHQSNLRSEKGCKKKEESFEVREAALLLRATEYEQRN